MEILLVIKNSGVVDAGISIISYIWSKEKNNNMDCAHRDTHHRWFIRCAPPHPCFMCYITLITPVSLSGRFTELVARLTTLGCSAGGSDAAGGVVITSSHTSWEGSLMTHQLCFQGRGHANASCMIYFTRQPVSAQPWISLSNILFCGCYTSWGYS